MTTTESRSESLLARPKRADARRNYDKVLSAAREAFSAGGESTALEEIARRAGVGIGTLYRHFPTRQALLEAIYLDEVDAVCRSAAQLDTTDPWAAFDAWLERVIAYLGTKRALAHELMNYLDRDAPLFQTCRSSLYESGQPLLERAQQAGAVRADVTIADIIGMLMAITKLPTGDREQLRHILRVAIDGLRYRA